MSVLWLSLSLASAVLVLLVIRRFFGARRTMKRMALSLAVCERALLDALGELASPTVERVCGSEVFVSPFEPVVLRLLSIAEHDLAALGRPAVELRRRLSLCIQTWNAAAGRVEKRASLLPLVLEAHHVARELLAFVEQGPLEDARSHVRARVLVALVAAQEPPASFVH